MGSWGALILAALLMCGCGEKEDKIEIPPDLSTAEQREKIALVVDDIQSQLQSAGVKVNLRALPIVVRDIEPAGYCQWDDEHRGVYIALDPEIFADPKFSAADPFVPAYYHTILHEIGHCYFGRPHETANLELAGKRIYFNSVRAHFAEIPLSVMNNVNWISIPTSFRDYYVREIAALTRIQTFEDLRAWDDVELRGIFTPLRVRDLLNLDEQPFEGPSRRLQDYCDSH